MRIVMPLIKKKPFTKIKNIVGNPKSRYILAGGIGAYLLSLGAVTLEDAFHGVFAFAAITEIHHHIGPVIIAIPGILVGYVGAVSIEHRMEVERLEGISQTTGAVAHRISQYLQEAMLDAEEALKILDEEHPAYPLASNMKECSIIIGELIHKVLSVRETEEYAQGKRILSIPLTRTELKRKDKRN